MTTEKAGAGGEGEVPAKLPRTEVVPFRMLPVETPPVHPGRGGSASYLSDGGAGGPFRTAAAFRPAGMAAGSFRCPFTPAQWQELERQALIYKCMIASVPIPPELLVPRNASDAISSHSPLGRPSAFGLRFSNNPDPEPSRCRRTDGKKWRCSRDVAPDQKYCERHMHRGRPRSRKPVEAQSQRINSLSVAPPPATANPTTTTVTHLGTSSAATAQVSSGFLAGKLQFQNKSAPAAASDRESRYMDWMRGEAHPSSSDQHWQIMQQPKEGSRNDTDHGGGEGGAVLQLQYEDALNLNFSDFGNGASGPPRNGHCCFYLTSDPREPPRRFIDAWSMSARDAAAPPTDNLSPVGKHPISSLTLSMPCGGDEEMEHQIQMGLCVSEPDSGARQNWNSSLPWMTPSVGGPLGEVLQSSTGAASASASPHGGCSNGRSSFAGLNLMTDGWVGDSSSPRESPPRVASSPSGVLQKTLASLSDSSGNSSPTFTAAKPEIALQWLNDQTQLPP